MLIDSGAAAHERLALGFGASRFRFAAPVGSEMTEQKLDGLRLATSYPGLVHKYLAERGITPRLIKLDGAVETAIRLGVADAIADVVETGTTLRQAGLELFGDPIMTVRGDPDPAGERRGSARAGATDPAAERRPGRPDLRDDGLRRARRPARTGLRDHARVRGADGLAAGPAGLARRPGDGPAREPRSRSWTICGRSALGPSWSPTSPPADYESGALDSGAGESTAVEREPSVAERVRCFPRAVAMISAVVVLGVIAFSLVMWFALPASLRVDLHHLPADHAAGRAGRGGRAARRHLGQHGRCRRRRPASAQRPAQPHLSLVRRSAGSTSARVIRGPLSGSGPMSTILKVSGGCCSASSAATGCGPTEP